MIAMLRCAPPLGRYLRSRDIDIVHTNDLRMHRTWSLATKLADVRFIWHQRSADGSRRLALYSRLPDRVLTNSQYCKSILPGSMGRRAITVDNPFAASQAPLDRLAARARLLRQIGTPEDVRIVGFVGNLTEQKRPQVFIAAAAEVCQRSKRNFVFPMFGEIREHMGDGVRTLIKERGLANECVLMGPKRPIEPWIAACDILLAPGVNEALGRTIYEANLCSTPVVAAADGGHLEVLTHGQTGLLVTPDDPSAFAEAIILLTERPDYAKRLATAALISAAAKVSVGKHTETLLRIYMEVAGEDRLDSCLLR
jgi:glycosyltransferase involved in cell wall biosynthesis